MKDRLVDPRMAYEIMITQKVNNINAELLVPVDTLTKHLLEGSGSNNYAAMRLILLLVSQKNTNVRNNIKLTTLTIPQDWVFLNNGYANLSLSDIGIYDWERVRDKYVEKNKVSL